MTLLTPLHPKQTGCRHPASQESNTADLSAKFDELVEYLRARNPIVQAYLTMAERNFGVDEEEEGGAAAQAVPIVPAAVLGAGIAATQVSRLSGSAKLEMRRHALACCTVSIGANLAPCHVMQARDPRADAPLAGGNNGLTTTMAWEGQQPPAEMSSRAGYTLGSLQRRGAGLAQRVTGTCEGVCSGNHNLSIDTALFPFLHPQGMGGVNSHGSLARLTEQRVQQLFSPFTLVKEYVLVMFQVGS
jgi:hypothetical protein